MHLQVGFGLLLGVVVGEEVTVIEVLYCVCFSVCEHAGLYFTHGYFLH